MANTEKTSAKRSGPGRRSAEHAESTRERIEAAALAAFSDVGFDAASTRLIANRAGVNPQLITYHFGTKLGRWKAVADQTFTHLVTHLGERMRGLSSRCCSRRSARPRSAVAHLSASRYYSHTCSSERPRCSRRRRNSNCSRAATPARQKSSMPIRI